MNRSLLLSLLVPLALIGLAHAVAADDSLAQIEGKAPPAESPNVASPPPRIDTPFRDDQIIDTQAVGNFLARFDTARRDRNTGALLRIDQELKKWIGKTVEAGRGQDHPVAPRRLGLGSPPGPFESLVAATGKTLPIKTSRRRVLLSDDRAGLRQLHNVAFRLRPLYGRTDSTSLEGKRRHLLSLLAIQ